VPAVGAVADARSVARLFAPLANGGESLLSEQSVRRLLAPRPDFELDDATYARRMPVSIGGFWIEAPGVVAPEYDGEVLCHPGVGGTVAWAELRSGLSVAICHDRMFATAPEHPFTAVADAVREALAERAPLSARLP
jgi:CubicO group peptidase (beta-lactamase class C family)